MWKPNIRPHGEYFAIAQAVTTSSVAGNQTANNPQRLDQSQGNTAIRVATPIGTTMTVAGAATITLEVNCAKVAEGPSIPMGTAVFTNDTGADLTFNSDSAIVEFVLPEKAIAYPYISVAISGSAAPTGTVDIFPHYLSQPRRG